MSTILLTNVRASHYAAHRPVSGYTKLFNSILASTIWRANDKTRLVWITLLAMADKHGIVEGSIPGLADFAHVSLPDCLSALNDLQAPDEFSRSKEYEGRRVKTIEGGWWLINHNKYRSKLNQDERREYLKIKQREHRARKQLSTNVNNVSDTYTVSNNVSDILKKEKKGIQRKERNTSPAPKAAPEAEEEKEREKARAREKTPAQNRTEDTVSMQIGAFSEKYPVIYAKVRAGANYRGNPVRDYPHYRELVTGWPMPRLEQMLELFLLMPKKDANNVPGTPGQFLNMAPECDRKLRENGL